MKRPSLRPSLDHLADLIHGIIVRPIYQKIIKHTETMTTLTLIKENDGKGNTWAPESPRDQILMRHLVGTDLEKLNVDGFEIVCQMAHVHGVTIEIGGPGMNIKEALSKLDSGLFIRRLSWKDGKFVAPASSWRESTAKINEEDIAVNDWVCRSTPWAPDKPGRVDEPERAPRWPRSMDHLVRYLEDVVVKLPGNTAGNQAMKEQAARAIPLLKAYESQCQCGVVEPGFNAARWDLGHSLAVNRDMAAAYAGTQKGNYHERCVREIERALEILAARDTKTKREEP